MVDRHETRRQEPELEAAQAQSTQNCRLKRLQRKQLAKHTLNGGERGVLTLGGVCHLVNPDQAVADFKHVISG